MSDSQQIHESLTRREPIENCRPAEAETKRVQTGHLASSRMTDMTEAV